MMSLVHVVWMYPEGYYAERGKEAVLNNFNVAFKQMWVEQNKEKMTTKGPKNIYYTESVDRVAVTIVGLELYVGKKTLKDKSKQAIADLQLGFQFDKSTRQLKYTPREVQM